MAPEPTESAASRAFEAAYAWLAAPRDSLPIAMARVGLGFTLVAAYTQYLPNASIFFGAHGIGGHDTIARHPGFGGITYDWYARVRVLDQLTSEGPMWALYALLLASSLAFMLGFKARIAGPIAAVVHTIFYAHNPQLDGGWGAMLSPFVIYVSLSECDAQLSIDDWRKRRRGEVRGPPREVAPWGMRLLQAHLCVMYMVPGFERLDADGWREGDMLLRALMNGEYGRFNLPWDTIAPVLKLMTWAVLILEPAAPILLWLRGVGRWWALLLLIMHASLELLADLGWWQFMMSSAVITFLPVEWLRKATRPLCELSPAHRTKVSSSA